MRDIRRVEPGELSIPSRLALRIERRITAPEPQRAKPDIFVRHHTARLHQLAHIVAQLLKKPIAPELAALPSVRPNHPIVPIGELSPGGKFIGRDELQREPIPLEVIDVKPPLTLNH